MTLNKGVNRNVAATAIARERLSTGRIQSVKPIHLRDCCIVPIAVRKCITIVTEQEGQEIGKGN